MLFNCLQLELRGAPPMAPGRYVLRGAEGGEIEHVLIVQEHAEARTRLTLIDAPPLSEEAQGQARLEALDHAAELAHLQQLLARVHAAARIASSDPHLHAPPEWARIEAARAGYGSGEELAHGRLARAHEIRLSDPAAHAQRAPFARVARRRHVPEPQERFAAILSGRTRALLCEELALRARADLDCGRFALGAILLERALAAALAELSPAAERLQQAPARRLPTASPLGGRPRLQRSGLRERISELEELRGALAPVASAALSGTESAGAASAQAESELLRHALERLEAALRARALSAASGRSPL